MLQQAAQHYSDFHRLMWVCGIIGSIGGAVGVFYGIGKVGAIAFRRACEVYANIVSIKEIHTQSGETAKTVAETKAAVDLMQTNHLAHLETGISDVARTNTNIEANTKDIRDGIIKLVAYHEGKL
jgi:hypothetical protein